MKVRAVYECNMLRPLGDLNLKEGEEVEIEVKEVMKNPIEEFYGKIKIPKELADEIINMETWD